MMYINRTQEENYEIKAKMAKYIADGASFSTFCGDYGFSDWMDDYCEGDEFTEEEINAIDRYISALWNDLITWDDLREAADRFTEANFPNHSDRFDMLSEIMQDGQSQYQFGDVFVTCFFAGADYKRFGNITEYSQAIYDEDGEIEDYKTLCYEIG